MKSKGDVEGLFALLHSNRQKDWMLRLDAAEALAQLLVAWLAFIVLNFLAGLFVTPAVDLLLLVTKSWLPEIIAIIIRLFLYLFAAFFVFRFVIKNIVLPHEGKN